MRRVLARSITAPWPSPVMSLATGGSPLGPYQKLSAAASVYTESLKTMVFTTSRLALAALIAAINVATSGAAKVFARARDAVTQLRAATVVTMMEVSLALI